MDSQPHADEAAHRQAGKVAGRRGHLTDQRRSVGGQRIHVVTGLCHLAAGLAAVVVTDAAIVLPKGPYLLAEHFAVHQQAVREYDGLRAGAGHFVMDFCAVDDSGWHGFSPDLAKHAAGGPRQNPVYQCSTWSAEHGTCGYDAPKCSSGEWRR